MNTFLRRLKYFSFGFIPSLIIVIFFFGARGCSWLPANRVKGSVIDRVLVVSEKNQKSIEKLGLNQQNLAEFISDAKVNFDKSSTHSNPKIYHFCQQDALGMLQDKLFYSAIKKSGKLDFSKSRLLANPKTHYLVFKNQQGIEIGANTLWYKDRIDIIRLDLKKSIDCH